MNYKNVTLKGKYVVIQHTYRTVFIWKIEILTYFEFPVTLCRYEQYEQYNKL